MLAPGEAQLLNLTVAASARRRGLGRRLLQRLLSDAVGVGAEQCFLEVRESNHAAIALYLREGFAPVARRAGYYPAAGRFGSARGCAGDAPPPRERFAWLIAATFYANSACFRYGGCARRRPISRRLPRRRCAMPQSIRRAPRRSRAQKIASSHIATLGWSEFAADVRACTACGLCRSRHQAVPGVGDTGAEWMFVGEAPGAEEDARGEPFVGQAGRLLDNMLAALGMQRESNVYIANVLKCRPPGNRTPEPGEVDACRPYLDRQIALIRPKLIVALGRSAATTLLGRRRDDSEPARSRAPLSVRAADRHLSPRVSAA